jgi:hypothetical protein
MLTIHVFSPDRRSPGGTPEHRRTPINSTKRRLTVIDHADQPMGLATLLPSKRRVLAGYQGAHIVAGGQTTTNTAAVGM